MIVLWWLIMQQWHIKNKRMTDIIFNSNKNHMIWFAQKLSFCQCRRTHFKWSSRSRVPTFSNGIYGVSVMTNGVWYCKISRICDVRLVQKNNFHWLQRLKIDIKFKFKFKKGLLPQIHQYIQHTYIHTGILQQRGVWKQENAYWSLYGMWA